MHRVYKVGVGKLRQFKLYYVNNLGYMSAPTSVLTTRNINQEAANELASKMLI
jgi:hypothetical protein